MNAHPGPLGPENGPGPMIDPFGRMVSYLRVSVTDRCDFRCTYCMAEHMVFLPKKDLLTLEELERLCSAFIAKGVRKIRLTGGEPLVRHNIMHLVRNLGQKIGAGGLDELTLTTNGSQLSRFAAELADSGVRRINVSIDTLDSVPLPASATSPRCLTAWMLPRRPASASRSTQWRSRISTTVKFPRSCAGRMAAAWT